MLAHKVARNDPLRVRDLKIVDFGSCTAFSPGQKSITMVAGSPHFAAPEVLRHVRGKKGDRRGPFDEKADVWSAGIIAHMLLTSRHPFVWDVDHPSKLPMDKYMDRLCDGAPSWAACGRVSKEAQEFLRRALTSLADDRPSADTLLSGSWLCDVGEQEGVEMDVGEEVQEGEDLEARVLRREKTKGQLDRRNNPIRPDLMWISDLKDKLPRIRIKGGLIALRAAVRLAGSPKRSRRQDLLRLDTQASTLSGDDEDLSRQDSLLSGASRGGTGATGTGAVTKSGLFRYVGGRLCNYDPDGTLVYFLYCADVDLQPNVSPRSIRLKSPKNRAPRMEL